MIFHTTDPIKAEKYINISKNVYILYYFVQMVTYWAFFLTWIVSNDIQWVTVQSHMMVTVNGSVIAHCVILTCTDSVVKDAVIHCVPPCSTVYQHSWYNQLYKESFQILSLQFMAFFTLFVHLINLYSQNKHIIL